MGDLIFHEYTQDPEDVKDYDVVLVSDDNDTWLSVAAAVIEPAGITNPSTVLSGANAKVWISAVGGTDKEDYFVRVPLTSVLGRVENAKFIIKVRRT